MAVASALGHVTCYRIALCFDDSGSISLGLRLTDGMPTIDRASRTAAVQAKPGASPKELEPLTTVHFPFSTPPKVLAFGQSSKCQVVWYLF